jgi:predicted CoA-binding protein
MPSVTDELGDDRLRALYAQTKVIAVVGASNNHNKEGHRIPRYLQSQGFTIVPVNPKDGEILGERAFRSLGEIEIEIDVVEVFRPPEEAEWIAREAIAIGTPVLWFQPGTDSDEGARLATNAGLTVVRGRCMSVTHRQLGLETPG